MRFVVSIEEKDEVVHAEVRATGSAELLALFACPSLAGAVGPLRELLRLAEDAAASSTHTVRRARG